ncbi:MAG: sigma-54-dependent Fis family transcriptional regulator [Nitrospinae bacterium]|nr:sigma-54-dependent Fis family transcriptional regulator [Nitrospinota bacterium]
MGDKRSLVFVIDDDGAVRKSLAQMLSLNGYEVMEFDGAQAALASPRLNEATCFVSDVLMPGMSGLDFLGEVSARNLAGPVVLVTAHGDVPTAVFAMKKGAYDFIEKPFERDTALAIIARAVEKAELLRQTRELKSQITSTAYESVGLAGRSRAIREVKDKIERYAATDLSVLITGETGAGKELVARLLHQLSTRAKGRFVAVNLAALPESLAMGELFGAEKGAYTGAAASREGKFEYASGGTIFLDEVNSASMAVQAAILRSVEEKTITRLGGNKSIAVDIRILAASNTDLFALARDGTFRADLLHRLNMVSIQIPPLREHPEDIPELVMNFLVETRRLYHLPEITVSSKAMTKLQAYPWPGNVRELKNTIVGLALAPDIKEITDWNPDTQQSEPGNDAKLRDKVSLAEKEHIVHALASCGGNLKQAARMLNISPKSLFNKMKKYGLKKESYK